MVSTLTPLASLIGILSPVERKTKPISVFIKRVKTKQTSKKQTKLSEKTAPSFVRPKLANCLKTVAESPKERLGTLPMILILIE
ncbi:Uncharacterised protein [Streptococcus pneumoniae]|nr:Uncharacterised protein [Streptococcus pneumoniae]